MINKFTEASLKLLLAILRVHPFKIELRLQRPLETVQVQRLVEFALRTQIMPLLDAEMPVLAPYFERRAEQVFVQYFSAAKRLNVEFNENEMPYIPISHGPGDPPPSAPIASWGSASLNATAGGKVAVDLILSTSSAKPISVLVEASGSSLEHVTIDWPGGVPLQIFVPASTTVVSLPIVISGSAPNGSVTLQILDGPDIDPGVVSTFVLSTAAAPTLGVLGEVFVNRIAGLATQPVGCTVSFSDAEAIQSNITIGGMSAQVDVVERMGESITKSHCFVTTLLPLAADSIPGQAGALQVASGLGTVPAQAGNYPYDLAAKPVVLRMRPAQKVQDYEASSAIARSSRVLCGAGSGRTSGPDLYRVERRYCLFSAPGEPASETSCALANMTLEQIAGMDCVLASIILSTGYMQTGDLPLASNNTQPGVPKFDRVELVLPVGYEVAFLDPFTGDGGVGSANLCKALSGSFDHQLAPGAAPGWHTIIYNPATITQAQALQMLEASGMWGVLYGPNSQMHIGKGLGPSDQTIMDWRRVGVSLTSLASKAESRYSALRSTAQAGTATGEFTIARGGWHAVMGSESPQNTGGDRIVATNFFLVPAPREIARIRLEAEMQSRRRAYAVYHLDLGRHVLGHDFLASYNEAASVASEVPQPIQVQVTVQRDSLGSMRSTMWPCLNKHPLDMDLPAALPERSWDQSAPGRAALDAEDLYVLNGNGWEYDTDHSVRGFHVLSAFLMARSWIAFDHLEGIMARVHLTFPSYDVQDTPNYYAFNRATKCVHAWGDRDLTLTTPNIGRPRARRREWVSGQGVTLGPVQDLQFISGRGLGWSILGFCMGFSVALPAVQTELWSNPSPSIGQNHNWISLILKAFNRWTTWHGFSSASEINNQSSSNPYLGQVDFLGKTGARPGGPHNDTVPGQSAYDNEWWPFEFSWQMNFTAEAIFAAMSIAAARGSVVLATSSCRNAAGAILFRARSAGGDPYNTPEGIQMDLTSCMSRGTAGLANPLPSSEDINTGVLYWRTNGVPEVTYWMMGLRLALRLASSIGSSQSEIEGLIRRIWRQGHLDQAAFLDFLNTYWVSVLNNNFSGTIDQRGLGWYADTLAALSA